MAKIAKQLRPKVEGGVVKYDTPQQRQFAPPPPPVRPARSIMPQTSSSQQQQAQQQKINPQKIVRRSKGCSGCRRKIGKS
ncbi:MAG: hypothetical protein ACXAC5_01270 [Promethearchaeota archaeon]